MIVIDENEIKSDCSGDNVDANGVCRYRYNTLAGGIVAVVVGTVASSLGTLALIHGTRRLRAQKKNKKNEAKVSFTPGGIRARF